MGGGSRFTRAGLSEAGFKGWVTFEQLRLNKYQQIPAGLRGVYVILRARDQEPEFLPASIAGHFKGRDPSVGPQELASNWVAGAAVLYVGKADWRRTNRSALRQRLKEFARIGAGEPVGHWGGRLIWQVADSAELLVAWKSTPDRDPRLVEVELLESFRSVYGKPPFANDPHLAGG